MAAGQKTRVIVELCAIGIRRRAPRNGPGRPRPGMAARLPCAARPDDSLSSSHFTPAQRLVAN